MTTIIIYVMTSDPRYFFQHTTKFRPTWQQTLESISSRSLGFLKSWHSIVVVAIPLVCVALYFNTWRCWEKYAILLPTISTNSTGSSQVVPLMKLDGKRAVQTLVNQSENIEASEVVSQLQKEDVDGNLREFLHLYLHGLFEKDPTAGKDYHGLQVFF